MAVTVSKVTTTPGTVPFDLILGESNDKGWTATVKGGPGLGKPILIDAFANGWRIDPVALAPYVHDGNLVVSIVWTPQKTVDWAVWISTLAIVLCLVLALWPVGRRRRRRHAHVDPVPRDDADPDVVLDRRPKLQVPFGSEGPRASILVSAVTAIVAGGVAVATTTPRVGLVVGAATLLVLLVPRLRILMGVAAVACVIAAAGYVIVHQHQTLVPDNGSWPHSFEVASQWAWAGVVLLGADGAVDVALRARARRKGRAAGPPGGPQENGDGDGHDDDGTGDDRNVRGDSGVSPDPGPVI
jgi:hypothetical protein